MYGMHGGMGDRCNPGPWPACPQGWKHTLQRVRRAGHQKLLAAIAGASCTTLKIVGSYGGCVLHDIKNSWQQKKDLLNQITGAGDVDGVSTCWEGHTVLQA